MHKIVLLISLIVLPACGTLDVNTKIDVINGLTATAQSVEFVQGAAEIAFDRGDIGWRELCRVDQYTRLATDVVEQGANAVIRREYEQAEDFMQAAEEALIGIGPQVNAMVAENCKLEGE